jgi:threonylcarbamoyladenosine tRNA methylthiotransferase MtaB
MKIHFFTLGCKTNQYESNSMSELLMKNGFEVTDELVADIFIVNTCSVTNIAERKSREMLRRAKKENPSCIVIACGCYAQVAKEQIMEMPEVDLVIGVNEKNDIVNIINKYLGEKKKTSIITDVMHDDKYLDFGDMTYTELTRAIVKVQDGCDRFCSYCIIPYARGKVRSRAPESVISEVKAIAKKGYKEIVITGIHLASYGKDLGPFDPKDDLHSGDYRFIDLLEDLDKIDGIERIRVGSIEPKWVNEDIANRLSKLNKICHHFHLSLQSGCDETLARMNRRYTTKEFEESVRLLRNAFDDVMLTTDVIVGFPGETEEEFQKTYEFLKKIRFYKMHIFKYSVRSGTKAEKMENQIDPKVKEERSKKLIALSNEIQNEYSRDYIGKTISVLFEEREGEYFKGHTANYLYVKTKTKEDLENKVLSLIVEDVEDGDLIAKIVE